MNQNYDVIVIGSGPAGYVAAIRAAQLGLHTACIEKRSSGKKPLLGGTCLNVGCIPSKALLDSSERYHQVTHLNEKHGITASSVQVDVSKMMRRKSSIVNKLTQGIAGLLKANGIDVYLGQARLLPGKCVTITNEDNANPVILYATNVILAPGSEPTPLPPIPTDDQNIVDSTGALEFSSVPKRLGIIGAGVIGLELGSVWNRLGADVVILEALPDFLSTADRQISKEANRQFKQQKLDIRLGAKVQSATVSDSEVKVSYQSNGKDTNISFDKLVVAIGRRPAINQLLSPDLDIELDERGFISVDDNCRTKEEGIWAVGDAVRGPMLAHKASEEGVMVAEMIAGQSGHMNFNTVPWVIYTHPEIAWVGETEQALAARGVDYRVGTSSFGANGRALAMEESTGLIKIIADASTDRILGVHIIGPYASELITEAVVAMEFSASAEDIARTMHAHPSLSEVFHEAALAVDQRAIHMVNKKAPK